MSLVRDLLAEMLHNPAPDSDCPGPHFAAADTMLATPAGQRLLALEVVYRFCAVENGPNDVGIPAYLDASHLLQHPEPARADA